MSLAIIKIIILVLSMTNAHVLLALHFNRPVSITHAYFYLARRSVALAICQKRSVSKKLVEGLESIVWKPPFNQNQNS